MSASYTIIGLAALFEAVQDHLEDAAPDSIAVVSDEETVVFPE